MMLRRSCVVQARALSPRHVRSATLRGLHSATKLLPAPAAGQRSLRPTIDSLLSARAFSGQRRNYAERMVQVPQMAESISEGTLKQFSKAVGDFVEQDEEIATIETDKIDVAVNAPEAGTIKELLASEEDTVTVGQDLVKLETGTSPPASEETGKKDSRPDDTQAEKQPQQDKSPEHERAAAPQDEQDKSPKQEKATSQKDEPGESRKNERTKHEPKEETSQKPEPSKGRGKESSQPTESASVGREERRVKMNRMRLRIAERLKQSQNTAASLTTFQKVDMSSLMEFRKLYKDDILKRTGVKLGFMSAFTRASVLAMKEIPAVNASIEGPGGGDTIVYRDYVDVSVAVATEKGLVTPVVRNVESMDLVGIESGIAELGKKARDNKLTIEDMAGGTFTISNGGVFGSLFGTPIINLPQTAVLGLHAINEEAIVVNGKIEARPMMYLALTYDHRLLDGREAVTFLVKIKQYIEDPRRMLLG